MTLNAEKLDKKPVCMEFYKNTAEPLSSYSDTGKGILLPAPPAPSKQATLITRVTHSATARAQGEVNQQNSRNQNNPYAKQYPKKCLKYS